MSRLFIRFSHVIYGITDVLIVSLLLLLAKESLRPRSVLRRHLARILDVLLSHVSVSPVRVLPSVSKEVLLVEDTVKSFLWMRFVLWKSIYQLK